MKKQLRLKSLESSSQEIKNQIFKKIRIGKRIIDLIYFRGLPETSDCIQTRIDQRRVEDV